MISKLTKIKNFGVYQDYSWGNLEQFAEKNIIYGWNYSGKTTLSRLFASFRDKTVHSSYTTGSFSLTYNTGSDHKEITELNIAEFPVDVRVFNSDYIRENLKWELSTELNGIAFDVGENVQLRQEIEKNLMKLERVFGTEKYEGLINKYQSRVVEFQKIDKGITDEARRVKNDVFNSAIEFTRTHFLKTLISVRDDINKYIIKDQHELMRLRSGAIASNNKASIEKVEFSLALSTLYDEVKEILLFQPSKTEVIQLLEDDSELYHWVKQGLVLHEKSDRCSFCNSPIEQDRIEKLSSFYSNAAAKLREKIVQYKDSILEEIKKIENLRLPGSKNDFNEACQDDFQIQVDRIEKIRSNYVDYLYELLSLLDTKLNENLFVSVKIEEFKDNIINDLEKWKVTTNKIIGAHNDIVMNFEKNQINCRERLKCHYVASFIANTRYLEAEASKAKSEKRIENLNLIAKRIRQRNEEIEAQLKSIAAGKNKLNQFISVFLNRDDISIDLTSDDKFILKRGSKIAENLSEGEKTAISFSYFLVSLESMGLDNLRKSIVFIDDPISSLDSNHISQIYALIHAFFFRQNVSPTDPKAYINCFKQLFISTHNFEFFSFLKESKRINKAKTCKFYLVKRINNDYSVIQGMPSYLKNHKSEYVYLFNLLYQYYKDGCTDQNENILLLPNAVRRFLEIYTLIKLPGSTEEVDFRLKYLFRETTELKTLHHFSHFTSLEKVAKHDELIMNLPTAVTELFEFLKDDTEHFESLKSTAQ